MPRFNEQAVLGITPTGMSAKAQASEQLASNISQFTRAGLRAYEQSRMSDAEREAGANVAAKEYQLKAPVTQYAKQHNAIIMRGQLSALKNQYTDFLKTSAAKNKGNSAGFKAESVGYFDQLVKDVPDEIKPALIEDYNRSSLVFETGLQREEIKSEVQQSLADIDTAADNIKRLASIAVRDDDLEGAQYNREQFQKLVIEPLKAQGEAVAAGKMQRSFDYALVEAGFMGDMADAYKAGKGEAFLGDFRNNPPKELSTEEHTQLNRSLTTYLSQQNTLHKKAAAQVSATQGREIAQVSAALRTGSADPAEMMARMEDFHNKGLISSSKLETAYTDYFKYAQKEQAKQENFSQISQRLAAGDALGLSKEENNLYFDEQVYSQFKDSEDRNIEWAGYVNRTHQMPTQMINTVRAQINSGDPTQMQQAANLMDMIDHTPGVIDSLPASERAFMHRAIDLMANRSGAEAIRAAQQMTDPNNQAFIKDREKTLSENQRGITGIDYNDVVSDELGSWYAGADIDPVNEAQITREWVNEYETNYKAGMSDSTARDSATAKIQRNWSQWQGQQVKYSPNLYYQVNGSSDWVMKQAFDEVSKGYPDGMPEGAQIIFRGDEKTARGVSVGAPSYQLFILDGEDFYPLPGNMRFLPDVAAEEARVKAENIRKLEEEAGKSVFERALDNLSAPVDAVTAPAKAITNLLGGSNATR